ncbi:MAG: hypothetical protein ACYSUY_04715 [Planctomycetota bacterium]|jgi:hypothetical protein
MIKSLKKILICLSILLLAGGCSYRAMISGMLGEEINQVKVNLKDKELIEEGNNRVYYSSQSEPLAQSMLQVLVEQEQMLNDYLGLNPGKFGVVIVQKKPKTRYIIEPPRKWTVFPVRLEDVQALCHASDFKTLYHSMTHERTEGAVTTALMEKEGLYSFNRETRWIGDGLAELLAFRFSTKYSPTAAVNLSRLESRHRIIKESQDKWHYHRHNLKDFKALSGRFKETKKQFFLMRDYITITSARYGMSFYYWTSMEKDLGSQTIREIVDKLKELQDPNNGNIEKAIRDAAGQNYVERIENLPADEALEFLAESMRHLIGKVREELSSNQRPMRIAAYEVLYKLDKDIFDIDLPDIAATARIVDIAPDTPAYQAGLRHGDIIEYVDGDLVESFDEFSENAGRFHEPEIEVKFLRRGTMHSHKLQSFAGCKFQPLAR